MGSTHTNILHDNVIGGMDYTTPPHLIGNRWRHTHNFRLTPDLTQIPRKKVYDTVGSTDIKHIVIVPGLTPGTGKTLLFTPTSISTSTGVSLVTGLANDAKFKRWSTCLYNGEVYYTNENNSVRRTDGASNEVLDNAPKARYLTVWYDHLVAAYIVRDGNTFVNRLEMSDLYRFDVWPPGQAGNEADRYDFVEWQMQDYPYVGITGVGKLRGLLWVYTPTAIIPLQYVGLPKIIQVNESGIITRTGNTFPWTMVALDNVHFYFDYLEHMFFAFDGSAPVPIGEPVRQYLKDNLSADYDLASKMYGYVDADNREVWWPFVSNDTETDEYDKAVVFNYRYRTWSTASIENVLCFCAGTNSTTTVGELVGPVSGLEGSVGNLGLGNAVPRMYGTTDGELLVDGAEDDDPAQLLDQDDPILETGDFHMQDLRLTKENVAMVLNAYWNTDFSPDGLIEIYAKGRSFLSEEVSFGDKKGNWTLTEQDGVKSYDNAPAVGRVLRYKFVAKDIQGLKFSGWSDLVRMKGAEK